MNESTVPLFGEGDIKFLSDFCTDTTTIVSALLFSPVFVWFSATLAHLLVSLGVYCRVCG